MLRVPQTVVAFQRTVHDPSGFLLQGNRPRRQHHQVLHVSPREAGVSFQSQRTDSGRQGGGGRCARVLHGADVVRSQSGVHVHGRHAFVVAGSSGTVRRCESGGTLFQVPRLVTEINRDLRWRRSVSNNTI